MDIKNRGGELRDIIQKNRLEAWRGVGRERENASKTGRVNLQMF